jgi:hypothetical protein
VIPLLPDEPVGVKRLLSLTERPHQTSQETPLVSTM